MSRGIFITGTGTDIGKTYVTALITKKLAGAGKDPAYFKAAMSGNDRDGSGRLIPGDAAWVKSVSGIAQSLEDMCPYVYEAAYSPHLASRIEGPLIDMALVKRQYLRLKDRYDHITVEGSGGIICPIRFEREAGSKQIMLEDVIKELDLPSLIVADAGLGTINSLVLTVEYMRRKDLPLKGIIFNNWHPGSILEEDNLYMCEELTGLPVIARVSPGDEDLDMDPELLSSLYG